MKKKKINNKVLSKFVRKNTKKLRVVWTPCPKGEFIPLCNCMFGMFGIGDPTLEEYCKFDSTLLLSEFIDFLPNEYDNITEEDITIMQELGTNDPRSGFFRRKYDEFKKLKRGKK